MRFRTRGSTSRGLRPGGFTLVELLVVIGIIALLISVLLPTLQSARRAADMVKCESALREIGNAARFYINDSKGWICPAKTASNYRISFTDWKPPYDFTGPCYWYQFLAKYVTRTKVGGAASSGTQNQIADERAAARRSLLWGCPAWEGYLSTAYYGGVNYAQTGYGFNAFPEYTASYPATNVLLGDTASAIGPTQIQGDSHAIAVPGTKDNWNSINPAGGKWYKWRPYEINGSERVLVADGIFWLLEVTAPAPTNGYPYPGMNSTYNYYTWTADGQTLYDVYRHGVKPGANTTPANTYKIPGGKVAYNVLFCDGHVSTLVDRESAYRCTRMRFPG